MTDKTTERQDLSVGPLFSEDALQRLRSELSFRMMMDPLITACDLALDWADANARWFDISTAPKDGKEVLTYPHYRVTSWSDELGGFWFWSDYDDDVVLYDPQPTHWTPLPPPPSNPPLPEPLEALGAVLRKIKGA